MNANKIVPCFWFHTENGCLAKLIEYYKGVFEGNFQEGPIIPLGNTPSGNTEMCEVIIFEKKYSFMGTATEHHSFNDALAFAIHCADQNEIDNIGTTSPRRVKRCNVGGVWTSLGFVGKYCPRI
ncbi:MAG: hypothetical protein EBQ67_07040 [Sphingobacteriia bacterium]|nr:hypothetical protein [Sphingobacteriia bacterium]